MSASVSLQFGVARADQTYHAGEDRALWELIPECLLVSDAILDDHDGCPARVDGRFQLHGHVLLIDGLVGAHDVIYRCNLRRGFDHYFHWISKTNVKQALRRFSPDASPTSVWMKCMLAMVFAVEGDALNCR